MLGTFSRHQGAANARLDVKIEHLSSKISLMACSALVRLRVGGGLVAGLTPRADPPLEHSSEHCTPSVISPS